MCSGGTVVDDAKFEPRLGRIRSTAGGRGKTYLQRVLRAVALSGPSKAGTSAFQGSRIARGFGTGRVLASRDRLSAFRTRRVIVKTRIVKMRGKGGKAAALHLRYIQRDGVTRDGEAGKLYGRDTDCADGKEFLERGLEDRHQFRFIVSAEDASEYPDLKPFVRKLMARMEDDLGTRLDWVAVDHHNTGHPHTHIVLRGRDDLGQDLVIARDYVAHGMRERAAEIVTLDLGPRTDREIEDRLAKQVTQERLTDIDRAMRRMASDAGDLSLTQSRAGAGHHQWAGRLQNLARMGLAEEVAPARWRLSPEMEPSLKAMGERDDIIKLMNRELAVRSMDRGYGELVVHDGEPVTGRVVSRGLCDARDDTHFLLVDGADGRVHYAEVLAEVPAQSRQALSSGLAWRRKLNARSIARSLRSPRGIAASTAPTCTGSMTPPHPAITSRPMFGAWRPCAAWRAWWTARRTGRGQSQKIMRRAVGNSIRTGLVHGSNCCRP